MLTESEKVEDGVEEIGETPKPGGMCKFAGCSTILRSSNKTGFCTIHVGRTSGDKNPEALAVAETLAKYERVKPFCSPPAPRQHTPLNLADARELTPKPSPSAIEKLRAAVFDSISEEDVRRIMKTQVEKALAGDPGSVKLLLGYISAGVQRPIQQVVMLQNGNPPPPNEQRGES